MSTSSNLGLYPSFSQCQGLERVQFLGPKPEIPTAKAKPSAPPGSSTAVGVSTDQNSKYESDWFWLGFVVLDMGRVEPRHSDRTIKVITLLSRKILFPFPIAPFQHERQFGLALPVGIICIRLCSGESMGSQGTHKRRPG